jgi:hypothetical protein
MQTPASQQNKVQDIESHYYVQSTYNREYDVFSDDANPMDVIPNANLLEFADWKKPMQVFDPDGSERPFEMCKHFKIKLNQQLGRGA